MAQLNRLGNAHVLTVALHKSKDLFPDHHFIVAVREIIIRVMNDNRLGIRRVSRRGRVRNLDRTAAKYGLLHNGLSLTVTGHEREDPAQCGNESGGGSVSGCSAILLEYRRLRRMLPAVHCGVLRAARAGVAIYLIRSCCASQAERVSPTRNPADT